ncbi:glycosyltransferase 87 family protein [Streptomyces sp. G45]|uniref:glycosyltransferase 87 family protein n=1 Tax=Streptomyces sp. G45 TaxID=3406627 RepID=UPI003C2803DC
MHPRFPRHAVLALGATTLAVSLWAWWTLVTDPTYAAYRSPADLSVYLDASDAPEHELYTGKFGIHGLPYLYPPFALLPFRALGGLDLTAAFRVVAAVSIAALALAAWASARLAGRRPGAATAGCALAVCGAALWTEPILQNLDFGQVNLVLLALVITDLATPDRRPWKGVGVGLAAGLKLTPALFIVYLLVTRRYRAAAVATAAFAGTVLTGWAALPQASADFWGGAFAGSPGGREYLANQSLNGVFVRFGQGAEGIGGPWWGALCGLLVVAGLGAAAVASRRGRELVAVCVVGVLTLVCSPLSWTHHWVWIAPVLVLAGDAALRQRTARAWLWTGGLFALFAAWPIRIDGFGTWDPSRPLLPYGILWYVPHWHRELDWDPFHAVVGNFYVWLGVGFIAWATWTFRTRTARPAFEDEPRLKARPAFEDEPRSGNQGKGAKPHPNRRGPGRQPRWRGGRAGRKGPRLGKPTAQGRPPPRPGAA